MNNSKRWKYLPLVFLWCSGSYTIVDKPIKTLECSTEFLKKLVYWCLSRNEIHTSKLSSFWLKNRRRELELVKFWMIEGLSKCFSPHISRSKFNGLSCIDERQNCPTTESFWQPSSFSEKLPSDGWRKKRKGGCERTKQSRHLEGLWERPVINKSTKELNKVQKE